jgi:hypothetical protein
VIFVVVEMKSETWDVIFPKQVSGVWQPFDTCQLPRYCGPDPGETGLIERWQRRQYELWRTHPWNSSRSCFVLDEKEVILADEILPMIVDHWQPKNHSIRKFRGIIRENMSACPELAVRRRWNWRGSMGCICLRTLYQNFLPALLL